MSIARLERGTEDAIGLAEETTRHRVQLARYVFELHEHWAPARARGAQAPTVTARSRVGRNDPCPCGSGKKHKKFCLR